MAEKAKGAGARQKAREAAEKGVVERVARGYSARRHTGGKLDQPSHRDKNAGRLWKER